MRVGKLCRLQRLKTRPSLKRVNLSLSARGPTLEISSSFVDIVVDMKNNSDMEEISDKRAVDSLYSVLNGVKKSDLLRTNVEIIPPSYRALITTRNIGNAY